MSRFVLTAQLKLQAPTNVKSVVNQIQKQLQGVKVDVQVETSVRAVRQINQITKATKEASDAASKMGDAFGVSLKRFAAFSIASRAIGLFSTKLAGAIDDAITFQNEMVRLSQVTGKSLEGLKDVSNEVGRLATTLGVASKDVLGVTTILAQAGLEAQDLTIAINALAKTALSPTFGKIEDTAEGAVAVIAQFGEGVGALERQLGSINKVSAKFAVESEDLVSVIRRTGGVFKASGGNLEELLALFTSVRATTRESAESIATGLRTIFTRIQRPATIQYLKQFGVQLTDIEGKFVGPYEAVRQLSTALEGLEEGDVRFIRVAEELGGFRQIGKVIPLLRQFELAEKARQAAVEGGDSLNKDVITAQQSLQVQFTKTRESFLKLIREIADTSTFKILVQTSLDFANALIKIADGIKPLLPLLGAFAAVKFAQGAGAFVAGIGAGFRKTVGPTGKHSGGKIHAFARGGLVPGTGNRDTVPAMLSPGEFVIRKSSVDSIGAENLANVNRYATGGLVSQFTGNERKVGAAVLEPGQISSSSFKISKKELEESFGRKITAAAERDFGKSVSAIKEGLSPSSFSIFNNVINDSLVSSANLATEQVAKSLGIDGINKIPPNKSNLFIKSLNDASRGNLFENILSVLGGDFEGNPKRPFDFPNGVPSVLKDDFTGLPSSFIDAKASFSSAKTEGKGGLKNKTIRQLRDEIKASSSLQEKYIQSKSVVKGSEPLVETLDLNKPISLTDVRSAVKTANDPKTKKLGSIASAIKNANISGTDENIIQKFEALGWSVQRSGPGAKRVTFIPPTVTKKAKGGSVSDTVPALLTPGEFVVNKKSAQQIGYGRLHSMNTKGVKGFAKGGMVGFANGRKVTTSDSQSSNDFNLFTDRASQVAFGLSALGATLGDTETAFGKIISSLTSFGTTVAAASAGLKALTGLNLIDLLKGKLFKGKATGGGFRENFANPDRAINAKNFKVAKADFDKKRLENKEAISNFKIAEKQRLDFVKNNKRPVGFGSAIDGAKTVYDEKLRNLNKNVSSARQTRDDSFKSLLKSRGLAVDQVKLLKDPTGFFGKAGQVLGQKAAGGSRIAQFAGGALSTVANKGGSTLLSGLAKLGGPLAAVTTSATLVSQAFNTVISSLYNYEDALKKATEAGNVEQAGKLAAQQYDVGASNSLRTAGAFGGAAIGGVIGSIFGPIGTAIGATAGAAIGVAGATALAAIAPEWAEGVNVFFGGNTKNSSIAMAEANAQAAKTSTSLVKANETLEIAMQEVANGTLSAADAMAQVQANTNEFNNLRAKNRTAIEENNNNKSTGASAFFRNVFSLGGNLFEGSKARNSRIDTENSQLLANEEQAFRQRAEVERRAQIEFTKPKLQQAAAKGATDEELRKIGGDFGSSKLQQEADSYRKREAIARQKGDEATATALKTLGDAAETEARRLKAASEANVKAIQENTRFFKELNRTQIQASKNRVKGISTQLDQLDLGSSGASDVEKSSLLLKAAFSGAVVSAEDFINAQEVAARTMAKFGVDQKQISGFQSQSVDIFNAQQALPDIIEKIRKQGEEGKLTGGTEDIKAAIEKEITNSNLGEGTTQALRAALGGVDVPEELAGLTASGGALDEVFRQVQERVDETGSKLLELNDAIGEAEGKLRNLVVKRIELEKKAIESYKASLDIQLEARKALEEFGGPAVKSADKLGLLNKKIDSVLEFSGVRGVGSGAASNISASSQQITQALSEIAGRKSSRTGITSDEADRETRLVQSQSELIDYTRERLNLVKEEIAIQEKKNALEKSAFEKLLGGDIQGAIEDQAAAGAAKLLQAGETGLARLFGSKALLGGLKNLEDQGLNSNQKALAARTAASSLGVSSRLADAFAGATPEINALQNEGRQLASVLNSLGQAVANTDRMNVSAQNVIINTAQGLLNSQSQSQLSKASDVANNARNQSNATRAAAGGASIDGGALSSETVTKLDTAVNSFVSAVDKLQNIQLSVKLDTTNVNINFNGGSFLNNLSQEIKNNVLDLVAKEIPKYKAGNDGVLRKQPGIAT